MKTKEIRLKEIYKNNKDVIYFSILLILIFFGVFGYRTLFKPHKNYIIENGSIDISSELIGCLIKSETIIDTDKTKPIISVSDQSSRVAKGEVVAVYKNEKYDDYINKINDMDKKIAENLQSLSPVYSNDISVIDSQIEQFIKQTQDTTSSYIKMQENKNRINELTYKRNLIISDLSPNGAIVKELIKQRDIINEESKKTADNIIASDSGVVTYKIDNLEGKYSFDNLLTYSIEDIENIFSTYEYNNTSKTGIKIVNNYEAYMIIKEKRGDNDEYISQGSTYRLKINEKNAVLTCNLVKLIQNDNYNYCIFSIKNGIENVIDARAISIEVTWKSISGLMVPTDAVKEDEKGKYLTVVKNGDYTKIYINIKISSDNMCIVENLDDSTYKFKIHDRVII